MMVFDTVPQGEAACVYPVGVGIGGREGSLSASLLAGTRALSK